METSRRVPTNRVPINKELGNRVPGQKVTVLGIDPGSRKTGYGVIVVDRQGPHYVASGCINVAKLEMPNRLGEIYRSVSELISTYQPDALAIEEVFVSKNAKSALLLGQARGVAIAAAVGRNLSVSEYAARLVKQAVVGTGKASKEQVQHMVEVLLKLSGTPQADAADALAIALCHVNTSQQLNVHQR